MKKVQMLELYGDDDGYTEDYETTRYHTCDTTQWQEITEEDFELLKEACREHNQVKTDGNYGYKYVILVYSEKRPDRLIADFLRKMEEEKVKKIRKEKEAEEKKKKKQEEREAAEKAKKLETLRKLQEELGNNLF
jgi:hypothetical protein